MGIILVLLLVFGGIGLAGVAAIYVAVTRGVRRLMQWGQEKGLISGAVALLDEAKASPVVRQVTGSTSSYRYLDTEATTERQVVSVVRPLRHDLVLGRHAEFVMSSAGKIEFYETGLEQVLEREFGRGSITWDHFHATIREALHEERVLIVQMANRMQVFDSAEYRRLSSYSPATGTAEAERLSVMRGTLNDLAAMSDTATRILTGVERLHAELSKVSSSRVEGDCDMVLDELRKLSCDAKLYM